MSLPFDDYEDELSPEEIDALEFLSIPGATVNSLADETLQGYIDAVGGIANWIQLRISGASLIEGDELPAESNIVAVAGDDTQSRSDSGDSGIADKHERILRLDMEVLARARAFKSRMLGKLDLRLQAEAPTSAGESTGSTLDLQQVGHTSAYSPDEELYIGASLGAAVIKLLNGSLPQRSATETGSAAVTSPDARDEIDALTNMLQSRHSVLVSECTPRQQAIYWFQKLQQISESDMSKYLGVSTEEINADLAVITQVLQSLKHMPAEP